MKLTITLNGITRTYEGDYYDLYNQDWNERVQDALDVINELETN